MARVYVSIGSNIERERHVVAGLDAMAAELGSLSVSSVYESEAVGFDGDNFYNLVVGFNTERTILDLYLWLRQIEADNGRVRGGNKYNPRTLDLDLLVYDDVICREPTDLPRDEILKNAFVLWPLAEIAPEARHPVTGQTYAQLWADYNKQRQRLWPVSFVWPRESAIKGNP